jgi:Putative prokaryotic signal transducing protein
MKELLRTNDPVRLSFLQALLRDSGIDTLVLDHHTSMVEGSIGAIPRRLMVSQRDYGRACGILAAAGEWRNE